MKTYLVLNLTNKTHYVGSSLGDSRPYKHLKNPENPRLRNQLQRGDTFFVFVSTDDESSDRSEEQFYLDFYHGSRWCSNINPFATGNPTRFDAYNREVKDGLREPTNLNGRSRFPKDVNAQRIENGTHNFLAKNRDPVIEARRIKSVRAALSTGVAARLGGKAAGEAKWVDPEHPELGNHHHHKLARLQREKGLPSGPENRIRVK